jgi:HIRAN domain
MSQADINRERRDAEIARTGERPMVSPFTAKVVGVSFVPSYPDNLYALDQAQIEAEELGEPLVVILVRNPANSFDANAIEAHVPALGDEWGMIGHLTRPIAARMAPEIDSGVRWSAQVVSVLIDPEHLNNPGVSVACARLEDLEPPT